MSPLRFSLVTTFYPPFNFGGDGIDVQRTARALVKRGHAVTVIHDIDAYRALAHGGDPQADPDDGQIDVIGLRSRLGLLSPLLTHQTGRPIVHGGAIRRALERAAPDVVVFNNISLVGGPALLSYGGDALRVYVAHEHWLVCPTHVLWRFNREPCDDRACLRCLVAHRRPPQIWRYTKALENGLRHVDLFIARSEFSRRKHAEFGFVHPMAVLPYFVSGPMPEQPAAPPPERPQERPYVLCVGRLARVKGLDQVIPAFARCPDTDLLIVGDGDERGRLEALARGLPNVRFLGRLANDRLAPLYAHALAALAPTAGYETFGIVLIEAFQHRTPVIARRQGPFPEIVGQSGGGLLYATEEELLAAIARLRQSPVYRDALGHRGYAACRMRWSEEVVVGQFLDLIATARAARPSS